MKITPEQNKVLEEIFYYSRLMNMFWLLGLQKDIWFVSETDVKINGQEILDALYCEVNYNGWKYD